ncbi:GntR family transcriptional regulator [Kineococcus rhizosphaerae]|uniref:GntR family transcriptional regulator n=1 Tax=Kineococcus rhizosphaerae TaxID=559628 RepID=A0A2T0R0S1_9ACTN|nr:GntR family transcriptional regulator [Kineococcus rhizosphaerae]PRY12912.1 GntR family transcriptional regulator [Kineococcus rhizosphaerae]
MPSRPAPPSVPARASLADSVHTSLLAWLMDGNAEPGEALSIDGLARLLGVSPTPVREAMARIESTGLLERVAMRGYRVAGLLSREEIDQLMDARLLLECHNVAAAAAAVDEDLLARLGETVERMARAPKGPSFTEYQDYHRADNEFHRLVNHAGGNRFLADAFEGLNGQLQRFRFRLVQRGVTDAGPAIDEHTAVVQALRAKDGAAAAERMREHLEAVRRRAIEDRASAGR